MHPPVPRSRSHGGSDLQWPPRPFRRGYLLLVLRFLRRIFSGIFVAFGLYLIRFSIFSGRPRWRSRPCLVPDVRPHAFCPFFLQGRRWWACSLLTFSFLTLWLLSIRVSRLLCYLTCSRVVLGFFRIGQSYTDLRVFLFHFEIDLTRDVYFFFSLIWSIGGSIFIEFSGKLKKKLVGITVLDFFFFSSCNWLNLLVIKDCEIRPLCWYMFQELPNAWWKWSLLVFWNINYFNNDDLMVNAAIFFNSLLGTHFFQGCLKAGRSEVILQE